MKRAFSMRAILATGVLFSVIVFSSCLKSNNNDSPGTPAAGLMAFNLSPDKPAIGIALSGSNLTNAALGYTNYTGGYLNIYSGSRTIEAYDAGGGNTFTASDYNFEQNKYYSLFIVGKDSAYRNIVVNDQLDSLSANSGKAFIRYVNAVPDSSRPMITVSGNTGSVISENAGFASVSGFKEITPGNVNIAISNNNDIQATRSITVEERKVYTVLFTGVPGSTDTTQSVQIKYIENGTLEDSAAQQQGVSTVSPRSVKSN